MAIPRYRLGKIRDGTGKWIKYDDHRKEIEDLKLQLFHCKKKINELQGKEKIVSMEARAIRFAKSIEDNKPVWNYNSASMEESKAYKEELMRRMEEGRPCT